MKFLSLQPNQIMTTNDFPVHNEQILKIYFKIAQNYPSLLPPTPVLHISVGLPLLEEINEFSRKHNSAIKRFFEENPAIEYIMCDGSHKTTALTLTHNPIHALLIENNADIQEVRKMVEVGDMFSFASRDSISEILMNKAAHFSEAEFFQTVEDKTKRMVDASVIPSYMSEYYMAK